MDSGKGMRAGQAKLRHVDFHRRQNADDQAGENGASMMLRRGFSTSSDIVEMPSKPM